VSSVGGSKGEQACANLLGPSDSELEFSGGLVRRLSQRKQHRKRGGDEW